MERCFQHRQPKDLQSDELEILKKLRDKYKTIIYFCGQPEAGTNRLDVLPFADILFYKSVFSDFNNYKKNLYGKNLFADFYHKNNGITDNPEYINKDIITEEDLKKIKLSWNIGVGTYPRWNFPQRLGTISARANMPVIGQFIGGKPLNRVSFPGCAKINKNIFTNNRNINVHARIDPVTCPSIAYQRVLFLNIISNLKRDRQILFLTGTVAQKQYYKELVNSKIVLSPFGWGEVCFRDFEAIISGALLLKPDMSHLVTWPDIYLPYETYIPLKWDGSDLLEKTEYYLNNEKERIRITQNAYNHYSDELSALERRFEDLLGEYFS
ncbi:MAG: glycosyltransferase [Treponema sp.]|nr:glycosyltransferase [Treponema sp.]